ncbi:MAG: hypothetical protein JSV86_12715 [Gemmatimonadota bacterium]|nr:MAG: hypothetical protein JSV86_12715 [Gemmatimonadota bacterium]
MLRLLIPFVLVWPVLALAAEASPLARYRGTPAKELLAMAFCFVGYFIVWLVLYQIGKALKGSEAATIVGSTILSLLTVTPLLALGYKIFGVKPAEAH